MAIACPHNRCRADRDHYIDSGIFDCSQQRGLSTARRSDAGYLLAACFHQLVSRANESFQR
jgi:hypothetical protein